MSGAFCISIDLELLWGVWDSLTPRAISMAESAERPIVRRLLRLFDRFDVSATWAVVGRVFDSSRGFDGLSGAREAWFAPELVDEIRSCRVPQEVGSHSYAHVYFSSISAEEAREDVERDAELRRRCGLEFKSFVFPRNMVGHLELLAGRGINVYRSHDAGALQWVRTSVPRAYSAANLLDKVIPITPPLVSPVARDGKGALTELPSSTLLLGRSGMRRLASTGVTIHRWQRALDHAAASGRVFHPWFHPSNFYYDTDGQFAVLESVLEYAAALRDSGRLIFRIMGEFGSDPCRLR